MAIQISGTQVIGNSRELTNIASVDATTATAIGAAGVGGGPAAPNWNPNATPNATFTSSGTWSKPTLSDSTWIIFYGVGGGGGANSSGSYAQGGCGGSALVMSGLAGELPSSVAVTIGAGATSYANGGDTTLVSGGITIKAAGGLRITTSQPTAVEQTAATSVSMPPPTNFFGPTPATILNATGGNGGVRFTNGLDSIYGAAGGGGGYGPNNQQGGTSTYAGDGGNNATNQRNGAAPGGGAAGMQGTAGNGANGSVRVYYIAT